MQSIISCCFYFYLMVRILIDNRLFYTFEPMFTVSKDTTAA